MGKNSGFCISRIDREFEKNILIPINLLGKKILIKGILLKVRKTDILPQYFIITQTICALM